MVILLKSISLDHQLAKNLDLPLIFQETTSELIHLSLLRPSNSISIHHLSTPSMDNTTTWKCTPFILTKLMVLNMVSWPLLWVSCSVLKTSTLRFPLPRKRSLITSSTPLTGSHQPIHKLAASLMQT